MGAKRETSAASALRLVQAALKASGSVSGSWVCRKRFLVGYDILTWHGLVISTGAFLVILAATPLGEALALRLSPALFDRLILVLLAVIAVNIFL